MLLRTSVVRARNVVWNEVRDNCILVCETKEKYIARLLEK